MLGCPYQATHVVSFRGMNGMGTLKIRCPNTGEHVTTGVVMDEEAFKLARLTAQVFLCDACGELTSGKRTMRRTRRMRDRRTAV